MTDDSATRTQHWAQITSAASAVLRETITEDTQWAIAPPARDDKQRLSQRIAIGVAACIRGGAARQQATDSLAAVITAAAKANLSHQDIAEALHIGDPVEPYPRQRVQELLERQARLDAYATQNEGTETSEQRRTGLGLYGRAAGKRSRSRSDRRRLTRSMPSGSRQTADTRRRRNELLREPSRRRRTRRRR